MPTSRIEPSASTSTMMPVSRWLTNAVSPRNAIDHGDSSPVTTSCGSPDGRTVVGVLSTGVASGDADVVDVGATAGADDGAAGPRQPVLRLAARIAVASADPRPRWIEVAIVGSMGRAVWPLAGVGGSLGQPRLAER